MDVQWRRAAVYVVCRDDADRILLTRFLQSGHPDSGSWTMPGGGMEWGESPEETAHRELAEETGLQCRLDAVLGVFSRWYRPDESDGGEAGHVIGIIYGSSEVTGEVRTEFDEGTTDQAAWYTLDEVRALSRVPLVDFVVDLIS